MFVLAGVQRGLVGEIIARFERKGLKLVALKMMTPSKALLEEHYKDLSAKSFFPGLIAYMSSGPVVCMVWEGKNAFAVGRQLLGATKPSDSAPGTIRFDFAVDVGRNLCHGSDGDESAAAEIALWFRELTCLRTAQQPAASISRHAHCVAPLVLRMCCQLRFPVPPRRLCCSRGPERLEVLLRRVGVRVNRAQAGNQSSLRSAVNMVIEL